MKKITLLLAATIALSAAAGQAQLKTSLLSAPLKVKWHLEQLTSAPGADESYKTVSPRSVGVKWSEKFTARGDAGDVNISVTSQAEKPLFIRIVATLDVPFAKFQWWNGYLNNNSLQFDPSDKILSTWFPANAAIGSDKAVILGLDPMMLCSRADSYQSENSGKKSLHVALPVYLEPGKTFKADFAIAASQAKYGYHDVIQTWYDLFPKAFKPADGISEDVISGEASYVYWSPQNFDFQFPSDMLRRYYGGRGCWEWCYKPFVRAGDWAITDKYSVGWRKHTEKSLEKHRARIRRRLTPAEFQSVAPMWYVNVCWTEWNIWKDLFPGIEYQKENTMRRCWSQDVIYGIYCYGTAYGELFRQGLTDVAKNFPASKGIGWDSCFAHRQIPADHAGFPGTDPKSFEKGKPMVLEAVGIAQLLDHNRTNFAGGKRMANAVNFKLVSPYIIAARTDTGLYEGHPMGDPRRLLRVEAMRTRLGSPKSIVWHKGAVPSRMKWVDWDDMTKSEAQDAYRQIMDNIMFLSYYWGCIPAPGMPAVSVKKLVDAAPQMVDLVRQGWQPSPAVSVPEAILAARYGKGAGASIVLMNIDYKAHTFTADFPAAYWDGKSVLLTGSANTTLNSTLTPAGTAAKVTLPARSMVVLRVCGLVKVPRSVTVAGELVAEAGRAPFHRLQLKTSKRFTAEAEFYRADAAAPVRISCEDDVVRFAAGEQVKYTLDTNKWPGDVQMANLFTATLSLVESPLVSAYELDKESIAALDIPAKASAGKVVITAAKGLEDEAQRVAEWFRFYTAATGKYVEPAINGTPAPDALVIALEINSDELKSYQLGRALLDGNTVKIYCRTAKDGKAVVLAALNMFDAVYPLYGKLPAELKKIGLDGKTLMPAPFKRPLRPTLLEQMKRCRIK